LRRARDNGETTAGRHLGAYTDNTGYYTIVEVTNGAAHGGRLVTLYPDNDRQPPAGCGNQRLTATPLTTVNIAATTNTVSEPNGTADFIITRR
jgi:hypothetical protein